MASNRSKKDTLRNSTIPVPVGRPLRSKSNINIDQNQQNDIFYGGYKRKADQSPLKNEKVKRCALGDLTNADHIVNGIIGGGGINGVAAGAGSGLNKHNNNNKISNIKRNNKVGIVSSTTTLSLRTSTLTTAAILPIASTIPSKTINEPDENEKNQTDPTFLHPKNAFPKIVIDKDTTVEKRPPKIMTRAAARASRSFKMPNDNNENKIKIIKNIVSSKDVTTKDRKNVTIRTTAVKPKDLTVNEKKLKVPTTRRISNEFEKQMADESLYATALDELPAYRLSLNCDVSSTTPDTINEEENIKTDNTNRNNTSSTSSKYDSTNNTLTEDRIPDGVNNFDKENWEDIYQVSDYAFEIFNYLKERETLFEIPDYMSKQVHINKWMRTLLVDWMVEVQETFELNHETLYLSVKLVDMYLSAVQVEKEHLQLIGAATLFICSKFEERAPPSIEEYIYVCDGAYSKKDLITTERNILKKIDFDLGIPISYTFLRRYAKCAKVQMQCLTLARYILELSLMEYDIVTLKDSQMACAALFMALRMNCKTSTWDLTLQYYSGYQLEDFVHIIPIFNTTLHLKHREPINTIRNKYSHKIFYEVAKIPLSSTEALLADTDILNRIKLIEKLIK